MVAALIGTSLRALCQVCPGASGTPSPFPRALEVGMPQVEERQPAALDTCRRQQVPGGRCSRGHGYIIHIIHTVPGTGQDTGQMSDGQMGTHPLAWPRVQN